MKSNNILKDETISIKLLVNKIIDKLKYKGKISIIFWSIFSILIALFNITILILSSIALKKVLDKYNSDSSANFISDVLPTILVSIVSITSFIVSIIITIYQGMMKSKVYMMACEDIQYETIAYIENESNEKNVEDFKNIIKEIYSSTNKNKSDMKIYKVMLSVLIGGNDE